MTQEEFNIIEAASKECRRVEVQETKKKKRFWLRSELYKEYGESHKEECEEAFSWIYNSPLEDWENMLETIKMSYSYGIHDTYGLQLKKAKELFAFLS